MDGAKEPEEHNHVQNKHSLNNGEYTQVENALDANKSSSDDKSSEKSELRTVLESFLNKTMKIKMSDGRSLIGSFLCTDKDANLILGNCQEYIHPPEMEPKEEPRTLGLAMIPGHHIVSVHLDKVTEDEPRIL